MKTTFDSDWQNWIQTNVNNGQDKNGIFKILLDEGYDYQAIVRQMNFSPSIPVDKLVNPFDQTREQAQKRKQPLTVSNSSVAQTSHDLFIPNGRLINEDIQLHCLESFLNTVECKEIIEAIKSQLRPSELSSDEDDQQYRTSRTCDLSLLENQTCRDLDERICKLLGINPAYSEPIQGQFYEVGQQFKAHTDYFEEHELAEHDRGMGQRTYTCMIYLNDVDEGGETCFTRVDATFKPKAGMAIIWSSLNADGYPNINSMHQALPVLKGYKAVITKWFRSHDRQTDLGTSSESSTKMFLKSANEYIPTFTLNGFEKLQLPKTLFTRVSDFYQEHKTRSQKEHVPGGFISSQSGAQASSLVNLSEALRAEVHDTLKPMMENWCNKTLEPTYVYGIREYHHGARLKTHRDRQETHIISAILNVSQEVLEDWPLLIEDNAYRQHQVLLKPGEMIFYEGGRLLHGRPKALKGSHYANIFCHFRPIDYLPLSNHRE